MGNTPTPGTGQEPTKPVPAAPPEPAAMEEKPTPAAEEAVAEPGAEEAAPAAEEGAAEAEPGAEEAPSEEAAPAEPGAEEVPKEKLADLYRQHPELKEFLGQHPHLRGTWFRAAEFNKMFPTVRDAERARDWALQLSEFDKSYFGDRNAKREFLQSLYENSLDQDGQPTGHYEDMVELVLGDSLGNLDRALQADPSFAQRANLTPEQARLAINYVRAMFGLGEAAPGTAAAPGATPRGAPGDERLRQWQADLERREAAMRSESEGSFYQGLQENFRGWLGGEITNRLKLATGLSKQPPAFSKWVQDTIASRVTEALRGDQFFSAQIESMTRSGGRDPETAKQIQAELEQRARHVLPGILRDVLKEAGATIVASQAEKDTRQAEAAKRREPVATGSPGRSGSRPGPMKSTGDYSKDSMKWLGVEE